MIVVNNGACNEMINQIGDYIKAHDTKSESDNLCIFAERYFSALSGDDLKERSVPEWYAILMSHWELVRLRAPHEAKIRIFNPDQETQGWHTIHTVIQLSHDDIPFIVDSIRLAINRHGYQVHFIIHFGGLKVERDASNRITRVLSRSEAQENVGTEAPVYIEIDHILDKKEMTVLTEDIDRVLGDVRSAVSDWRKMVNRAEACVHELEKTSPNLDSSELAESRDFLRWLMNNNFTFLGARDYKLIGDGKNRALQLVPGSGLGVLRDESESRHSKRYTELPPQARKMALSQNVIIIAKTNTTSTVHRDIYTDYIGVKRFNEAGELIGECRFIGLFTSTAYRSSLRETPLLRHKLIRALNDLGFPLDSHDGKEAVHILETLPRDDIFQGSHEDLLALTLNIIHLKERRRVRLLVRRDAFDRFLSCLVYVPREVFNTDVVQAIRRILMASFAGTECNYSTYFSDSILARIHYNIRVNPKIPLHYDVAEIEKKIILATRTWRDDLSAALVTHFGESAGLKYFGLYKNAFSAGYMETYSGEIALGDILKIEELRSGTALSMLFHANKNSNALHLKLFHAEDNVVLSDVLPILENMGLRIIGEQPHEVRLSESKRVWINDFTMVYGDQVIVDIQEIKDTFQEAFTKIWSGEAENDGFNRLISTAKLTWQETAMLRAYTKYLRQTGFTFSQNYIEQALIRHHAIASALVQLFLLKFQPTLSDEKRATIPDLLAFIEQSLDAVTSLDEDRILRRVLEVIQATIRTNFFQNKPYLSFKLNPEAISDLPLPKPKFEIFVYSPSVEGVHLRCGKVARGGIRWSDRREDFRTEVLGLMKAQQVKNTVIVPEGAKGGFVVKKIQTPDMSRDDYLREGIRCYSIFISGLLDITDNIKEGVIVPPENVVRYDDDDPYLVVAADKGTATFSDIANGISETYGFWLGDAFASGGSAGYDHKKMGITSRGAWVSVTRHFRELGIDAEKEDFTVVGIGDMAGDVFGNGMLLSRHTKLIAAFNHLHIFIDPTPDASKSYEERQRLFQLPRSSWQDYDATLISTGGGVFSRSAKSIKLTPEIQHALDISADNLAPNELIRAILKAPVDLIWNGGIGTFIKSTEESHVDVGDKSNDAIRVNAAEVRARVIAEGGNLGVTQLARIEYSLNGGVINTDFIDNSAGVDCSDHEVNIKILLNRLVTEKHLTLDARNILLEKMTHEIAELVLIDNYEQTQMLSLEVSIAEHTIDLFRYYMNELEMKGHLNRALENLPDEKSLLERKANNKPLTRPEIAMLLAYCKMYLKRDIIACSVIDDPYFEQYLLSAFPQTLINQYGAEIKQHSLRREIIATQLCKSITDRMGINFVGRLQRETGAHIDFIIRAFAVASSIFQLEPLWMQIEALDNIIPPQYQYELMLQLYYLVRRSTRWILRNRKENLPLQESIASLSTSVELLIKQLPKLLEPDELQLCVQAVKGYVALGVPEALAQRILFSNALFTSLDIIDAAERYNQDLDSVAKTYYMLGNRMELNWLRDSMNAYVIQGQWDELARSGFRDDLDKIQRKLSVGVMSMKSKSLLNKSIQERVDAWLSKHGVFLERWRRLLADIKSSDTVDFVTYSVVLRELFDFVQAG